MDALWRYAKAYSVSRMFPDVESAEQAFVKISAGAELGMAPFQSMNSIDVIKGKPVVKPALLAGLLDSNTDYDYTVEWEGETACTITIFKGGKERGVSRFSMEDAERAGLLKPSSNGRPSNYLVYPRNMLWARAMSNAVRWYAPGLTMGPVYVDGEITADVEAIIPEGVVAKPRTRVTAEVTPDPEPEQDEPIEDAEVVDEEPVLVVPAGQLRPALAALDANQRRVLYTECGITKGMKLAEVTDRLWIKWAELGLPDDVEGEPVPISILGAMYERAAKRGSAEAFQHMLDTDEDLNPGDQASIEAIA
jgi:hypothetical protein